MATRERSLSADGAQGEIQTTECTRRKSYQEVFGQGFDSPRIHQTGHSRTQWVRTRYAVLHQKGIKRTLTTSKAALPLRFGFNTTTEKDGFPIMGSRLFYCFWQKENRPTIAGRLLLKCERIYFIYVFWYRCLESLYCRACKLVPLINHCRIVHTALKAISICFACVFVKFTHNIFTSFNLILYF